MAKPPVSSGTPMERATAAPDAGEVGAGDGPDGGRPHDDRQGAGAVLLGGQVGGGVARPVVDRRGGSQHERAEEQHDHGVDDAGDDGQDRSGRPDEVARDQPDTSPAAAHDAREPVGGRGRAEDLEGLREAGHRLAAGDVAGEERGGRDTDGDADRADRLGDDERADRTALDVGDGEASGQPRGHRSVSGSSSWRCTAAHTCLGGTPASSASWRRAAVEVAHDGELGPGAGVGRARGSRRAAPRTRCASWRHPITDRRQLEPGLPPVAPESVPDDDVAPARAADDGLDVRGPPVGEVPRAADRPVGGPALAVALLERDATAGLRAG